MAKLVIVYHSQSGANLSLAKAAYHGARDIEGLVVEVLSADETSSEHLLTADAALFCFAEMNAAISGGMKAMLDRVFYPLTDEAKILSIACAMSVGNDGASALQSFKRIMTGLNAKWVSEPIVVKGVPSPSDLAGVTELAMAMGEGSVMGIF